MPAYTWESTNSPIASSRTDDIWFHTPETGWLVNSNGEVARTDDGGDTWSVQLFVPGDSVGNPYLRCIHFAPDGQTGFLGAITSVDDSDPDAYLQGLMWRTSDGGASWEPVTNLPKGASNGVCGLSMVGADVIYGSGNNDPNGVGPTIVKSADGGASWELIDMSAHATNLIDVFFWDADNGWVVGGLKNDACAGDVPDAYKNSPQYWTVKPVVLQTSDGGKTWTDRAAGIDFPCGEWGWKIFWLDRQNGFVSLENFIDGAILRTTDGGQTWTRLPINDSRIVGGKEVSNANLEGIGFVDANNGWVGGWGDADFSGNYNSVTSDAGETWSAQDYTQNAHGEPTGDARQVVNRFRFFGSPVTHGYCSGKRVYRLVIDGASTKSDDAGGATALPCRDYGLTARRLAGGGVAVSFELDRPARKVMVGVWTHFGFRVRTLLRAAPAAAGRYSLKWDGHDHRGVTSRQRGCLVRLFVDGRGESEVID